MAEEEKKRTPSLSEFQKAQRAADGKKAMLEYQQEVAALRARTEKLRAMRLAREAEIAANPPPPPQPKAPAPAAKGKPAPERPIVKSMANSAVKTPGKPAGAPGKPAAGKMTAQPAAKAPPAKAPVPSAKKPASKKAGAAKSAAKTAKAVKGGDKKAKSKKR